MRKLCLSGLAVLVISALVHAGGDPWKSKPIDQWNEADVQHVFTDSPWARSVKVEATWQPMSLDEQNGAVLPQQTAGTANGGNPMGNMATVLPAEHSNAGSRGQDVAFQVFWMSSRTVRTAMARGAVLHSQKTEAEAEKFASQPLDDYQILVRGSDLTPFYRQQEPFFVANSALELKKSKQKIAPSRVEFERDPNKKTIMVVRFYFPKKTASGADFISPDEKNVEFTCKLGSSTLHAMFEPRNMVDHKGPDL